MLVLARKVGQQIVLGGEVTLTVIKVSGKHVRLGISAPAEISVRRVKEGPEQPAPAAVAGR